MGYNNNYNKNNNQSWGKGNRQDSYSQESYKLIEIPLHEYYKDKGKLYLPEGIAHKKARDFNRITSHQLRKILNQSKACKDEANTNDFVAAKNHLFSLLPLAAYNAGRDPSLKPLYYFLAENLNEKSIQSKEDIETFDDLFTSVVAFHKFEGGK